MVDYVTANYQTQKFVSDSNRKYADTAVLIAKGKPSTFAELAATNGSPKDAIVLQAKYKVESNNINDNKQVTAELNQYETIIVQALKVAADFQSEITIQGTDVKSLATAHLSQLEDLLNIQYQNGKYLLSGGANVPPVQNLTTTSSIVKNTYTTNYYQGSDMPQEAVLSNGRKLEYGFTAADPAFKYLIGSLNEAIGAVSGKLVDNASLKLSRQALSTAIDKLINLYTSVGNQQVIMEKATKLEEELHQQNSLKVNEANGVVDQTVIIELQNRRTAAEAAEALAKQQLEMRRAIIHGY